MSRAFSAPFVALAFALTLAAVLAACDGGAPSPMPARDFGAQLFRDARFAESAFNRFACSTCHATTQGADPQRILSGGTLYDVAARPRFLGGQTLRLLDAVNFCYVYFMRGVALSKSEPKAKALYEYLLALSPSARSPNASAPQVPMTLVRDVVDVPPGDAVAGRALYSKACGECHGALGSGAGRISESASLLPQVTTTYGVDFPGVPAARVVIEKVRHGQFFGVGGNMPFYSREALSDADLASILAAMGL